jgi:glutaminase
LADAGMHANDPRLKQVHARLHANPTDQLSFENFKYVIESASLLIYRALTRKLVIPDWHSFIRELDTLYRDSSTITKGKVASYIPELANADPNTWSVER